MNFTEAFKEIVLCNSENPLEAYSSSTEILMRVREWTGCGPAISWHYKGKYPGLSFGKWLYCFPKAEIFEAGDWEVRSDTTETDYQNLLKENRAYLKNQKE